MPGVPVAHLNPDAMETAEGSGKGAGRCSSTVSVASVRPSTCNSTGTGTSGPNCSAAEADEEAVKCWPPCDPLLATVAIADLCIQLTCNQVAGFQLSQCLLIDLASMPCDIQQSRLWWTFKHFWASLACCLVFMAQVST